MPSHELRRRLRLAGITAGVVVITTVVSGIAVRASNDAELREWTDEQAVPTVAIVRPGSEGSVTTLELPARLEALARAPLYARVSGYLKSWNADIGTPVKAGQLLAEIEAPDVEQQLLQAEADLATARANAALAASTAKRWQSMLGRDSVSRQEVEERVGDLAARQAEVEAQRANVGRLRTMHGFTRIVAPFDGIVTARATDIGALIAAGGGSAPELFVVSDITRLRVYVNVPQVYASRLAGGAQASITVPDRPGQTYTATIEASSGAVNAATGTTLVQLSVGNPAGELLPGGYANVSFELPRNATALSVPASALIFDGSGPRIATVGEGSRVVMKPITIARDHGTVIDVATGLDANDRVIETPPDGLVAGTTVNVGGAEARSADAEAGPPQQQEAASDAPG